MDFSKMGFWQYAGLALLVSITVEAVGDLVISAGERFIAAAKSGLTERERAKLPAQ